MKKRILPFIFLVICLSFILPAIVLADADDTPAGAVVLAPNSSSGGTLTETIDNLDYWQITTTFDGSLVVKTTSDPSLEIDLYLYDQNGTTQISSYEVSFGVNDSTRCYYLVQGTYYVLANRYSGSGSYLISNVYVPTGFANDSELNDTVEISSTLAPNGSTTGHLGYYGNLYKDNLDWWKVTITYDGALVVNTTSDATLDIDLHMYDQNGTTEIATYDTSVGIHEATHRYDLTPGTYYIHAYAYAGYGSYTISSLYTPTGLANDPEPNDTVEISSTVAVNDSTTGHLGYFNQGKYDVYDWWKVSIPADGKLTVRTYSDVSLDIDLHMYDTDGTTEIAGYDISTGRSEATHYDCLKAGTYYVKANVYSGYGSYWIYSELIEAQFANDAEPNDLLSSAQPITLHSQTYGHLGFYGSGTSDVNDFYTFTLPAAWDSLFIRTDGDPTMDIDLTLYDQSGTEIASSSSGGTSELLIYLSAGAGTYSTRLHRYSGYGCYGVIVTNSRPNTPMVDVKEEKQERTIPRNYRLTQNYPNPFNPNTTFQYEVPNSEYVSIKVYNILGKEMATLVNGVKPAGNYNVVWNASDLPSGVYFYQIRAGKFIDVKKAVLMK